MFGNLLNRWRRGATDPGIQRAHALFDQGDYAGAAALYEAALAAQPSAALCVNAGYSRFMQGDAVAAEAAFRRALAMQGNFSAALVGLGDLAARRGAHGEAVAHYDTALATAADSAVAHNNRAQSLFALGRTAEAWQDAEWRYAAPGAEALYPHRYTLPRWQGEPLPGRLLVHWEQGYGDIIQHLRFLPLLQSRVADFAFECPPPLLRLAMRLLPARQVIEARAEPADVSGFAAYAPLLSLPHLLGLSPDALPQPPYLRGDAACTAAWRARSGQPGTRLAGIAWRGSNFDPSRAAALGDFAAVLPAPGLRWVSLQKDVDAAEAALLAQWGVWDASAELGDFADTADLIAALDAVVCVDTAVAHLAGALGKPACVLLNEPAAVRWTTERGNTPWYPSMRLLRKPADAPWADAIKQLLPLLHAV